MSSATALTGQPSTPDIVLLEGDCRQVLATLPDESVHCCVCSPPYYGLRDYGVAGQIGLEDSVDAFVAEMVAVFREVRRVLRKDGTLWLNLGDSYNPVNRGEKAKPRSAGPVSAVQAPHLHSDLPTRKAQIQALKAAGFKEKDRLMVPARVALALQADGWWLRDEIVWHKPNPMPSSVADRTTPSHEMVYMLSRSSRYYYDLEAIKEPTVSNHASGNGFARPQQVARGGRGKAEQWTPTEMRQPRSVWSITTKPFRGAHFATMAPELAERCIRAGCPTGGVVLDPFGGSGTTGFVAQGLGRRSVLIELNPSYAKIARHRLGLPNLSIVAADSGGQVDIFDGLFGEVFEAPAEDIFA